MSEPTPEQIAQHEAAQQRELMAVREFQHGFQRLFEELDEDQLGTLKTMLHIMVNNTGHPLAASWEGMVAHALKVRFNICITCGVNHDLEFTSEPSGGDDPPLSNGDGQAAESPTEPSPLSNLPAGAQSQNADGTFVWRSAARAAMVEYHLDDAYEDGTNRFMGFKCTGINGSNGPCGLIYPTIEDRMKKGPENCHGCFQRNAHG